MRYGVAYKGSKNLIARKVVDALPSADTLIDLFCGGGAVTHAAMLSGKWSRFVINDIDPVAVKFFTDGIQGLQADERRVIDRQTFHAKKNQDGYVKFCWSFGNNGMDYVWGKDLEKLRLEAGHMVMDDNWRDRYGHYKTFTRMLYDMASGDSNLQFYGRKADLVPFERLDSLKYLTELADFPLEAHTGDYRDLDLSAYPSSITYCDIPYNDSKGYSCGRFDQEAFFEWALQQSQPLFVSSYELPEPFICVKEWGKIVSAPETNQRLHVTERLFVPPNTYDLYYKEASVPCRDTPRSS